MAASEDESDQPARSKRPVETSSSSSSSSEEDDKSGPPPKKRFRFEPAVAHVPCARGQTEWVAPAHIQIASVELIEDAGEIEDPRLRDVATSFNEIIMYCRNKSKAFPKSPSDKVIPTKKRCVLCKKVLKPKATACMHCRAIVQ